MYGGSIEGNTTLNDGGGLYIYQGDCILNSVDIHGNIVGTGKKGSGIYLYPTPGYTPSLTLTGTAKVGNSGNTNTLCLCMVGSSNSAFVTAKNLAASSHINIEPYDYSLQRDKTLVKVPDGVSAAYKDYFHLTDTPSNDWVLAPSSDDKELILRKETVVAGGGSGAWNRLKTAIQTAEAGDTIVIDGTIQATSTPGNNGEIPINRSITIRGKSGNRDTDALDANKGGLGLNARRIFKVTGANTKLTLENITLKNGKAAGEGDNGMGGGIYCKSIKEFTVKGCAIADCGADIEGGGICVAASGGVNTKAVITGTSISGNTAGLRGGGIAFNPSNGTPYITGVLDSVTVENNSLTSTDSDPNFNNGGAGIYFGGGYNDSSKYTVKGGTIAGNNAGNYNGGGAYIKTNTSGSVNGTLTLKDGARISGNSAENGGGVAVNSAKLIIESGCTIGGDNASQGNTAKTSGGGISVGKKAECTIKEGVTIRHNRVTQGASTVNGGGGLHIYGTSSPADSGTVTITGTQEKPVRIEDNEARGSIGVGGGIANNGTITLTHVHISGCKAPDSAGLGGGIYVRRGACTLIDTKVTGCEASGAGGGVYVYKGGGEAGEFTMQSSTRIVPSANNDRGKNDIFLRDGACIKLSGGLTGKRSVGRITVPDTNYNASTKVLVDDITDGENYKKFTVTPGGSPVKNWYVGSNGALTTTQPTP